MEGKTDRDRLRNVTIKAALKFQMRWLRHLQKMGDSRPPVKLCEAISKSQRPRERPRETEALTGI